MLIIFLWKQCLTLSQGFLFTLLWMCSLGPKRCHWGTVWAGVCLQQCFRKVPCRGTLQKIWKLWQMEAEGVQAVLEKQVRGTLSGQLKRSAISDLVAMALELLRIAPNDLIMICYSVVLMSLNLMCLRKHIRSCWFQPLDLKACLGFFRWESFCLFPLCSRNMLTIF